MEFSEKGYVKFFNVEKGYGFLVLESGEEIFFHWNDGRTVKEGKREVELDLSPPSQKPQKGDAILFNELYQRKGPKACPWVFSEHFEAAKMVMAARGPLYRIIATCYKKVRSGKLMLPTKVREFEVWTGWLCDLELQQSTGSDPLAVRTNGSEIVKYHFEVQKDGRWVACPDPRPNIASTAA